MTRDQKLMFRKALRAAEEIGAARARREAVAGLAMLAAFTTPPPNPPLFRKAFAADDHPRSDDGRFVAKGEIAAAAADPAKADALRATVTDPAQRAKLDTALDAHRAGGGGVAAAKPARPGKPSTVDQTHALVRKLADPARTPSPADVRRMADAFAGHTHAELKDLKARIGVKASGNKADQALKIAQRAATAIKHPRITPDQAHAMIAAARAAGDADPKAVGDLSRALAHGLTAKELHAVKAAHGIKASGVKAEAAWKIARRLLPVAPNDWSEEDAKLATEPPKPPRSRGGQAQAPTPMRSRLDAVATAAETELPTSKGRREVSAAFMGALNDALRKSPGVPIGPDGSSPDSEALPPADRARYLAAWEAQKPLQSGTGPGGVPLTRPEYAAQVKEATARLDHFRDAFGDPASAPRPPGAAAAGSEIEYAAGDEPPGPKNRDLSAHARPKLSPGQIAEVQQYLSEDTPYYDVNEHLRGGGSLAGDDALQQAILIAAVMPEPVEVRRGLQVDDVGDLVAQLKSGTFHDAGFMSTTTERPFAGNVQLKILARHGLDASHYGYNTGEMLLPAGSNFRVVSYAEKNGKVEATLEQQVEEPPVEPAPGPAPPKPPAPSAPAAADHINGMMTRMAGGGFPKADLDAGLAVLDSLDGPQLLHAAKLLEIDAGLTPKTPRAKIAKQIKDVVNRVWKTSDNVNHGEVTRGAAPADAGAYESDEDEAPTKSPTGVDLSPAGDKITGVGSQSAAPIPGETKMELSPLQGSERQVAWANKLRADALDPSAAHPTRRAWAEATLSAAGDQAGKLTHAKDWIDGHGGMDKMLAHKFGLTADIGGPTPVSDKFRVIEDRVRANHAMTLRGKPERVATHFRGRESNELAREFGSREKAAEVAKAFGFTYEGV